MSAAVYSVPGWFRLGNSLMRLYFSTLLSTIAGNWFSMANFCFGVGNEGLKAGSHTNFHSCIPNLKNGR